MENERTMYLRVRVTSRSLSVGMYIQFMTDVIFSANTFNFNKGLEAKL